MNSDNYIVIQGWMRTELGLKGNELLVYAIIYGFSQTENQKFCGSLQYLADWCGATKQGVQKNLKNLIDKGLIAKKEVYKNNVKFCEYSCMVCNSVAWGIQHSCINNIDNNIEINKENNISKDILLENAYNTFEDDKLYSEDKPKKKRKNLYEKCLDAIYEYTDDLELQDLLVTYLKIRLEVKDKPLYYNMWRGLLNKLFGMSDKLDDLCKIVQQSVDKCWLSFYEIKSYSGKRKDLQVVSSEFGSVTCNKADDEEMTDVYF